MLNAEAAWETGFSLFRRSLDRSSRGKDRCPSPALPHSRYPLESRWRGHRLQGGSELPASRPLGRRGDCRFAAKADARRPPAYRVGIAVSLCSRSRAPGRESSSRNRNSSAVISARIAGVSGRPRQVLILSRGIPSFCTTRFSNGRPTCWPLFLRDYLRSRASARAAGNIRTHRPKQYSHHRAGRTNGWRSGLVPRRGLSAQDRRGSAKKPSL